MASEDAAIARGEWHAAGSSRSLLAALVAEDGQLAVRGEDGRQLAGALAGHVEISARVGSIPRRLSFPDGSLFETCDNEAIDQLVKQRDGGSSGWVHWLEQFRPRLVGIAAAAMLLAVATYKLALPAMVELAVVVTPPFVPQVLSAGTLQTLDRAVFSPSTLPQEQQERILEDFASLASHAKGGAEPYRLHFRYGGVIGPNAFALPDGTLIITDELVEMAGDDRQMILGVLAHEIGHVEHEHSLRQLYRAAGLAGLVMLVAGDIGSAMEDILAQGGGLLALSYSRGAESEADRRSVELMRAAGMDAVAIARFFERLEEQLGDSGGASILSTHPSTLERRKAIIDYDLSLDIKGAD